MEMGTVLGIMRPLLNFLRDLLFVFFYVKTIRSDRSLSAGRILCAATALFCAGLPLLFGNSLDNLGTVIFLFQNTSDAFFTAFRSLIHFVCYYVYIRTLKHISRLTAAYDALLICTVSLTAHNLFLTPVTRPILNSGVQWVPDPTLNTLLCLLVVNGFTILVYALVYHFIPLGEIKNVGRSRMAILLLLSAESQYLNCSLKEFTGLSPELAPQFSVYLITIQLLLMVCLGYIERYHRISRDYMRTTLENQAAHSLLENISAQQENDELIRHIRHDLRNHLISLRHLINDGKNDAAIQYLDSLRSEYVSFQPRIKTGNNILDGILIQKMAAAEKAGVAFSVSSDFSYLESMNSADMCILFGNLLDNALEACQKVESGCRHINIRGNLVGESILYIIENSCTSDAGFEGSFPKSTKGDPSRHGIGLVSVSRIIRKYGGTIAFSCKDDLFSVVCSFPLPLSPVSL